MKSKRPNIIYFAMVYALAIMMSGCSTTEDASLRCNSRPNAAEIQACLRGVQWSDNAADDYAAQNFVTLGSFIKPSYSEMIRLRSGVIRQCHLQFTDRRLFNSCLSGIDDYINALAWSQHGESF